VSGSLRCSSEVQLDCGRWWAAEDCCSWKPFVSRLFPSLSRNGQSLSRSPTLCLSGRHFHCLGRISIPLLVQVVGLMRCLHGTYAWWPRLTHSAFQSMRSNPADQALVYHLHCCETWEFCRLFLQKKTQSHFFTELPSSASCCSLITAAGDCISTFWSCIC